MGQTQSAALPSREEILSKTKGGKDLIGAIFSWMVSEADIKEFYLLANPEHCRKYIFVTASALQTLFRKVQLEPKEGEKGAIYLQHVDVLTKPKNIQQQKAHDSLCLKLAFFYVRIFQVFAALAFSVLDNDTHSEVPFMGRPQQAPLLGQSGGVLSDSIFLPAQFEPFRRYLTETGDSNIYRLGDIEKDVFIGALNDRPTIILKHKPSVIDKVLVLVGSIKSEIIEEGRKLIISIKNIHDGLDDRTVASDKVFRFNASSGTYVSSNDVNFAEELTEFFVRIYNDTLRPKYVEGDRNKYTAKVNKYRGEYRGDYDFLDRKKEYSDYKNIFQEIQRRDPLKAKLFQESTKGVKEGLHTYIPLGALSTPPKAHCIARSLQLLSEAGMQTAVPPQIYSSICKTKFKVENKSLPPADGEIDKEVGIYTLAQLFYDILRDAAPAISEQTKEQQQNFFKKMKYVFEEKREESIPSIDRIRNKLPTDICTSGLIDKTLKVQNRNVIVQVRDTVRKMIEYQINHTAQVTILLKKLFLIPIQPGKPLEIHPNVKKEGIEEVNRIAAEARNLLVKYYEQCEIMYRIGTEIFAKNKSLITTV